MGYGVFLCLQLIPFIISSEYVCWVDDAKILLSFEYTLQKMKAFSQVSLCSVQGLQKYQK